MGILPVVVAVNQMPMPRYSADGVWMEKAWYSPYSTKKELEEGRQAKRDYDVTRTVSPVACLLLLSQRKERLAWAQRPGFELGLLGSGRKVTTPRCRITEFPSRLNPKDACLSWGMGKTGQASSNRMSSCQTWIAWCWRRC